VVEVFYRGYGCWALKESYPEIDPISEEYIASGVFTLLEHDAAAYKYTQKLDEHIFVLLPSITHRDSEFIRIAALNPDLKYKAEECYFRINVEEDKNNDRILCVIQLVPNGDIDPNGAENHESENKSKRKKGESDRERTAHVKDWVRRTDYMGGKPDKIIVTALQSEQPKLWGKKDSIDVFRSWLKSPEAKEAKPLLPNPRRK
jgi:hypothetical protein